MKCTNINIFTYSTATESSSSHLVPLRYVSTRLLPVSHPPGLEFIELVWLPIPLFSPADEAFEQTSAWIRAIGGDFELTNPHAGDISSSSDLRYFSYMNSRDLKPPQIRKRSALDDRDPLADWFSIDEARQDMVRHRAEKDSQCLPEVSMNRGF